MRSGTLSVTVFGHYAHAMVIAVAISACMTGPARAAAGVDFDIPTSELTRVRKEAPVRKVPADAKKKKQQSDVKHQEPAAAVAAPIEPAGQPAPAPVEPEEAARTVAAPAKTAPVPAVAEEHIRIHHSPYSFVVAARRTVVPAVISSDAGIKTVICRVKRGETGTYDAVVMERVDGTGFTYAATIPGLAQENSSLVYSFAVTDSLGREFFSQEYTTPVTASPVIPGWQLENSGQ